MSEFEQEIQVTAVAERVKQPNVIRRMLATGALLSLGVAGIAAVGGSETESEAASDAGSCEPLDSGVIPGEDEVGEPQQVIEVSAPEGELIARYCLVAETDEGLQGPFYFEVDPPSSEATIFYLGENILHYSLEWAPKQVCDPLDSGKIDVPGNKQSVEYTAPEGYLVDAFCVKAGNDLDFEDIDPNQKTVLITDIDDDKDVSHYSVKLVKVPETTVPVTTVPETTVPVTTVPETTVPVTTVPETTVPVTTVPETTVPATTPATTTTTTTPRVTVPVPPTE